MPKFKCSGGSLRKGHASDIIEDQRSPQDPIEASDHLVAAKMFAQDYTKRDGDNAKKLIVVRVEATQVDANPGTPAAYARQFDLEWVDGKWE